MPKAKSSGGSYYAVARGKNPGIYETWADCKAQVDGFYKSRFMKFHSLREAEQWLVNPDQPSTAQPKGKMRAESSRAVADNSEGGLRDVVYSDGACKRNGTPEATAGVGVWWGHGDPRNIAERCPGVQTNNRAELLALIRVLETTRDRIPRPLLIKSDSQYSMNCVNKWLPGWRQRGFRSSKGEAVKNLPLITYLDSLLDERKVLGQQVDMEYVKGHAGIEGNEGADEMANLGCLEAEILEEPDWRAKEAEVRRNTQLLKSNASRREIHTAGSSRRASVTESIQSASTATNVRSSRHILTSVSTGSRVTDVSTPSTGARASRFKPYNPPPQVGNASSSRVSATTTKVRPPGYQPTHITLPPSTKGITPDVEYSHPFYRAFDPDGEWEKTRLYRDVATMTPSWQRLNDPGLAATHVDLSDNELEGYPDVQDDATLELVLED